MHYWVFIVVYQTSCKHLFKYALIAFSSGSIIGFANSQEAYALPVLPGNEHPHNNVVVTWPIPAPVDQNKQHQHWNELPLDTNNGENSWDANKAWDNNGSNTTFNYSTRLGGGATDFGHGFISNRVLYYFDKGFDALNKFHLRVKQAFSDWVDGAIAYKAANEQLHPGLVLGFNFSMTEVRPATESYINIKFDLTEDGTTGLFRSSTKTLDFNLQDFSWYTDADEPGATDRDFLTTARHEVGHAVGFGHNKIAQKVPGSSIMWSNAAPLGKRVGITNGDYEGVMALYTQPVPGPLPILGIGAAFCYSRKLRKRIKNARK